MLGWRGLAMEFAGQQSREVRASDARGYMCARGMGGMLGDGVGETGEQ